VVIPGSLCDRAVRDALQKAASENTVRAELAAGEPLASVFARHGIL